MINFNPIHKIFSVGNFHIYSWGLMFILAFLITGFFILRESKKRNIPRDYIINVLLLILVGAILGGRLFYVFEHFNYFSNNFFEIFNFGRGGETSYGGIFLGLFFVWLYTKKNKTLGFLELLDLIAPYAVLGLAIGRIGCFLNWDDFGHMCLWPWGIKTPNDVIRHPTQLYESLYCFAIFFILLGFKKIRNKSKNTKFKLLLNKKGSLFLFFIIFYSFFRFFNDFLRIYEHYFLGLSLSQLVCVALFWIGVFILIKKK